MTTTLPPRGTRVETQPPHALFQAQCRALSHRAGVDLICAMYPALTRSWVKRNFSRMMRMDSANMVVYLHNCVQIANNADLIHAVMETHSLSREKATEVVACADLAGRYARAEVRLADDRTTRKSDFLRDETAVYAVARLDLAAGGAA